MDNIQQIADAIQASVQQDFSPFCKWNWPLCSVQWWLKSLLLPCCCFKSDLIVGKFGLYILIIEHLSELSLFNINLRYFWQSIFIQNFTLRLQRGFSKQLEFSIKVEAFPQPCHFRQGVNLAFIEQNTLVFGLWILRLYIIDFFKKVQ